MNQSQKQLLHSPPGGGRAKGSSLFSLPPRDPRPRQAPPSPYRDSTWQPAGLNMKAQPESGGPELVVIWFLFSPLCPMKPDPPRRRNELLAHQYIPHPRPPSPHPPPSPLALKFLRRDGSRRDGSRVPAISHIPFLPR